jgi:hypothetical protein
MMTTTQAGQIHDLHMQVVKLERENGILQHQVDNLLRQIEDLQFALHQERALFDRLTALEPAADPDDTQRDIPDQAV